MTLIKLMIIILYNNINNLAPRMIVKSALDDIDEFPGVGPCPEPEESAAPKLDPERSPAPHPTERPPSNPSSNGGLRVCRYAARREHPREHHSRPPAGAGRRRSRPATPSWRWISARRPAGRCAMPTAIASGTAEFRVRRFEGGGMIFLRFPPGCRRSTRAHAAPGPHRAAASGSGSGRPAMRAEQLLEQAASIVARRRRTYGQPTSCSSTWPGAGASSSVSRSRPRKRCCAWST